jgi:hypothetical protein
VFKHTHLDALLELGQQLLLLFDKRGLRDAVRKLCCMGWGVGGWAWGGWVHAQAGREETWGVGTQAPMCNSDRGRQEDRCGKLQAPGKLLEIGRCIHAVGRQRCCCSLAGGCG